jgi:hypothetical protein
MSSQQSLATKVEATTGNDDHNDVEPSGDMYREEWVRSRRRTLHGQRRRGHGLPRPLYMGEKPTRSGEEAGKADVWA